MWKENRSVWFDAPKDSGDGKGTPHFDVGSAAPALPHGVTVEDDRLDPATQAEIAQLEVDLARDDQEEAKLKGEIAASYDAEAAEQDVKYAETPAGLRARVDALEKAGLFDEGTSKKYKEVISGAQFRVNKLTLVGKIEEKEELLKAKIASGKLAGAQAEGAIDADAPTDPKKVNKDLNAAIDAIPDKEKATGIPAEYAEFFTGKKKSQAQEVTEKPRDNKEVLKGISVSFESIGTSVSALEGQLKAAQEAFKANMAAAKDHPELLAKLDPKPLAAVEEAIAEFKAKYINGQAAFRELAAAIKTDKFEGLRQNFIDTYLTDTPQDLQLQMTEAVKGSNEVATTLLKMQLKEAKEASDRAEAEAGKIAYEEELKAQETQRAELQARNALRERIGVVDTGAADTVLVVPEASTEAPKEAIVSLGLRDPKITMRTLREIAELTAQLKKVRALNGKIGADLKLLDAKKEQGSLTPEEERNWAALHVGVDKLIAEGKATKGKIEEKTAELKKLEANAGTAVNLEPYKDRIVEAGYERKQATNRAIGRNLTHYGGALEKLGQDFVKSAERHLDPETTDGNFGLYLVQLDTLIERSKTLISANPDLKPLIEKCKDLAIATARREMADSKPGLALEGSKLEEVTDDFTKVILAIDNLAYLKGKLPDKEVTALRAKLVANPQEGQAEIDEKYTLISSKNRLDELAKKGVLKAEQYAELTDSGMLLNLLQKIEVSLPAFEAIKSELGKFIADGYIPEKEAAAISAATIYQLADLQESLAYNKERIGVINSLLYGTVEGKSDVSRDISMMLGGLMNDQEAQKYITPEILVQIKKSSAEDATAKIAELRGMDRAASSKEMEAISKRIKDWANNQAPGPDDLVGAIHTPQSLGSEPLAASDLVDTKSAVAKIKAQEEKDRLARVAQKTPGLNIEAARDKFRAELAKAPEVKPPTPEQAAYADILSKMADKVQESAKTQVATVPEKAKVDPVLQETADKMHLAYNDAKNALEKVANQDSPEYAAALDNMRKAAVEYALAEGKVRTYDKPQDRDALAEAVIKVLKEQNLVNANSLIISVDNDTQIRQDALGNIMTRTEEEAQKIAAKKAAGEDMVFTTDDTGAEPAPAVVVPTPAPPVATGQISPAAPTKS